VRSSTRLIEDRGKAQRHPRSKSGRRTIASAKNFFAALVYRVNIEPGKHDLPRNPFFLLAAMQIAPGRLPGSDPASG
jgi:hypothetical protein